MSGARHTPGKRPKDARAAPPIHTAAGVGARTEPSYRTLLACAVVFGLGLLLYAPAFRFQLLNWDDQVYVTQNAWIQGLTFQHVVWIFTHPYFLNYLPLHLLSYAVDHAIWGMSAFGFHAGSIVLNALNGALALLVVRRLTGSLPIAFIAALLFAAHPSHVEAVAWISIRKDLLSTSFALLAVLAYLSAWRGSSLRKGPYALSIALFGLGLLSKMSIVALPGFFLLLDWVRPGPLARGRRPGLATALWSKVPYAAVGVGLLYVNWMVQAKASAPYAQAALTYAAVKGHSVWNYLGMLVGAKAPNPDYDTPALGSDPLRLALELAGLAILPLLAWAAYARRRPVECLGLAWIFITLLPAIAFPLVTYMADRYLYAPSLGFAWTVASLLVAAAGALRAARVQRAALAGATVLLVAGFTWRTERYLPVWRDSESLWTHVLTRSRDYRAFNNLGAVRFEQKRWAEAEQLYRLGTRSEQPNALSYRSLSVLYYTLGRHAKALGAADTAMTVLRASGWDPAEASEIEFERGAIHDALGDRAQALGSFHRAVELDPSNANARYWLEQAEKTQP